ncbi:MAG: hypothetical protein J0G28_05655 [Afipia sp.]|nr:hypothetical protein [Afipia sp.]OJW63774.1 MAG: hypothetical protein BGO65_09320 [Afipia sp. 64-13]
MTLTFLNTLTRTTAIALLGAALALPAAVAARAESGAFANYAGQWSGSGTISIANNDSVNNERIRCRGKYTVSDGNNVVDINLRCASDSYRFDLASEVRAAGSQLSGSWTEASRGVNGTVEGRVSGGQVTALVQTAGYAASFNISTRGNKQTIAISSKGELRAVNISLSR